MTPRKKKQTARGSPVIRRQKTTKVKTAKGRKLSSTRWLQRQLNDPYVAAAARDGYRSRAAYKLLELDDKFGFLKPGARVVDLGAAPGGWTQAVLARCGNRAKVVALDIVEMEAIDGATVLRGDFLDEEAPRRLKEALGGPADVVLSDMAAPLSGHRTTDHLRIMALVEEAVTFAADVLAAGGVFIAKVFQGGAEAGLLAQLNRLFAKVRHAKPAASRKESSETYLVATGFRSAASSPETGKNLRQ